MAQERLFNLLPGVYRALDAGRGGALRALTAVLESQRDDLAANVAGLYENWFIETCQDWVVPYLAELVGVEGLDGGSVFPFQRAWVGNAIALRRRKGIAAALQPLAHGTAGWYARADELFPRLAATQAVTCVRPGRGTADLSDLRTMARVGTPFDRTARTVRVTASGAGEVPYGLPDVALFVWRLESQPLAGAAPCPVSPPGVDATGLYTFHPLGYDQPLFHLPGEVPWTRPAGEAELPVPITRPLLAADTGAYYGPERGLAVEVDGRPVPPDRIVAADLGGWERPPAGKVAVDPQLGRFAFPLSDPDPSSLTVSYAAGFSADLGGGPYERSRSLADPRRALWWGTVGPGGRYADLGLALADWRTAGGGRGVIEILDSGTYVLSLSPLTLPDSGLLVLQAADQQRPCLRLAPGFRAGAGNGALTLSGLLIEGPLAVSGGDLQIEIADCTLLPRRVQGYRTAPTGPLLQARWSHTATFLGDGRVLVAGGEEKPDVPLASAEVYTPEDGRFSATGAMHQARSGHTATQVPGGVAVIGGRGTAGEALDSLEVWDVAAGTFALETAKLQEARWGHTATMLPVSGLVLIAGGRNGQGTVSGLELFNPFTRTFTPVDALFEGRYGHAAAPFQDGTDRVLIAGGRDDLGSPVAPVIFDGATGKLTRVSGLFPTGSELTATPAGLQILTAGGESDDKEPQAQAMLFPRNLGDNRFVQVGGLLQPRWGHTATRMPGGLVVALGGEDGGGPLASVEAYDPATEGFGPSTRLAEARTEHTAVLLDDGRLLVAGGRGTGGTALATAELLEPHGSAVGDPTALRVMPDSLGVRLSIRDSVVGALRLPGDGRELRIADSIVDAFGSGLPALAGSAGEDEEGETAGPPAVLERVTVLGRTRLRKLPLASDVLFAAEVEVEETDEGGVRYSYVPPGSRTPRRYRCQPGLALAEAAAELGLASPDGLPPEIAEAVRLRLRPVFTSVLYPAPGYVQLALACSPLLRAGGSDGAEMGAFHRLRQPQREAYLRRALDDHLPFGRRAVIVYVT